MVASLLQPTTSIIHTESGTYRPLTNTYHLIQMSTTTQTKIGITPRRTGTTTWLNDWSPEEYQRDVCEVRGRLEFQKDQAAWALAMSRNPYVAKWSTEPYEASATFMVEVMEVGVQQLTDDLIDIYHHSEELFGRRGIEPHVLIESLKLADEYDGDRNGPLGWDNDNISAGPKWDPR